MSSGATQRSCLFLCLWFLRNIVLNTFKIGIMEKLFIILFTLILIVLVAYFTYLKPNFQVVNGYAAKNLCSCVFVAGHEEKAVKEIDLGFSFIAMANTSVDYQSKSTTSDMWGLVPRKAVYRDGIGCVLVNELSETELLSQTFQPTFSKYDSLENWFEFPDSLAILSDEQSEELQMVINEAMKNDEEKTINTRALVVLHKGQLVGESYEEGYTKDSRLLGWSMTKSITSTMAGLLIRDGKFALETPAPIASWSGTPKEGITYQNLLQMSSSLEFEEEYGSYSDANKMLWISDTMGVVTVGKSLIADPGEKWYYSSGTTNLLMLLMRQYFDSQEAYWDYLNQELFNRIGANSFIIEPDAAGNFVGSSFGWATARDWARVGQLYLNNGNWAGEQILAESWVEFVQQSPDDPESKDVYGGQFWLNKVHPGMPEDSYFMNGFHGQRVIIIPSKELVVVRLGVDYNGSFDFDGFVNEIITVIE